MNALTLNDFHYQKEDFQASYGTVTTTKYLYEKDTYRFVIFPTMNEEWWMANIYKDKRFLYETKGRKDPKEVLLDVNEYIREL